MHMNSVFRDIVVIDDNIINNVPKALKPSECIFLAMVVMFGDG